MSLLMKALKQAERDHDEAINTVIVPKTDAGSPKTEPRDAVAPAPQPAVDNGIELALNDQSGAETHVAPDINAMSPSESQPQPQSGLAAGGLDISEPHFEQFDSDQIDNAIDQHYGEQPDLSRPSDSNESEISAASDVAAMEYAQTEAEPDLASNEQPIEPEMSDEPDDLGFDLDSDNSIDDEQALIDTSNEGAFLGTAKLATVKKRPGILRKVIAGLSLAVLAMVGVGWYALELLHIPGPANEPIPAATTVPTVQSASSSLNGTLASTDFQSTASVGAVEEFAPRAEQNNGQSVDGSGSAVSEATQVTGATGTKQAPAKQLPKTNGNAAPTPSSAQSKKPKSVTKQARASNVAQQSSKSTQLVPATLNPGPKPEIQFRKVSNAREQQSQLLNDAYAALRANDDDKAAQLYQQALANDRLSADVWVGLATLAVRRGDVTKARQAYENALRINPNDSVAIAGKLSLQGEGDALSQESRYRTLLAANPNNAALQFELASTLAAQDRWVDAQKAYFNAASAAPSHPDYAFNLAVSLEHIRQPGIALQYYLRALELAANHRPEFDRSMAEQRISALRSELGRK